MTLPLTTQADVDAATYTAERADQLRQGDTKPVARRDDVDLLIRLVKDAEFLEKEADEVIRARDKARQEICSALGYGDQLAAIHNGHLRIGELMTRGDG